MLTIPWYGLGRQQRGCAWCLWVSWPQVSPRAVSWTAGSTHGRVCCSWIGEHPCCGRDMTSPCPSNTAWSLGSCSQQGPNKHPVLFRFCQLCSSSRPARLVFVMDAVKESDSWDVALPCSPSHRPLVILDQVNGPLKVSWCIPFHIVPTACPFPLILRFTGAGLGIRSSVLPFFRSPFISVPEVGTEHPFIRSSVPTFGTDERRNGAPFRRSERMNGDERILQKNWQFGKKILLSQNLLKRTEKERRWTEKNGKERKKNGEKCEGQQNKKYLHCYTVL